MYKQKIAISIKSDFDREKLFDEFIILMSSLCRSGQIMGSRDSPYLADDEMICYQSTLEQDSLDSKYNDEWVNLRIKNLEDWCNAKLITEVIGKHIPFYDDICRCTQHESYVLFTTYLNESSAIDCGTCGRPVPLYKIKELTDEDRTCLQSWEGNYTSCDDLNMSCTVGEKWAIKQMSDPTSQLSILGLDVCNRIYQKTGVPTYYYLYNYRAISVAKDRLRRCPSCNGEWLLPQRWLNFHDFKCDRCRLVSTLTERS